MTTEEIYILLGLGTGVNAVPINDLRALWRKHGAAVTRHWQHHYGQDPFCAAIAKRENWNGREARKA